MIDVETLERIVKNNGRKWPSDSARFIEAYWAVEFFKGPDWLSNKVACSLRDVLSASEANEDGCPAHYAEAVIHGSGFGPNMAAAFANACLCVLEKIRSREAARGASADGIAASERAMSGPDGEGGRA